MIKLVIKTPGIILKIPGSSRELRSPLELDITKSDVNGIILYLRSLGISNYQILCTSESYKTIGLDEKNIKIAPKKVVETRIIEKHITQPAPNNTKEFKHLSDRMDNIQELLLKLNDKNRNSIYKSDLQEEQNIKSKQKTVDKFIPKVNTSGMQISTTSKTKTKNKSASDVDYIADLLRDNLNNT